MSDHSEDQAAQPNEKLEGPQPPAENLILDYHQPGKPRSSNIRWRDICMVLLALILLPVGLGLFLTGLGNMIVGLTGRMEIEDAVIRFALQGGIGLAMVWPGCMLLYGIIDGYRNQNKRIPPG